MAKPRASHPTPDPAAPSVVAMVLLGAWTLLLLFAPPGSNRLWALDGFRSLAPAARLGLVAAAVAAALIPRIATRSRRAAWALGAATALLLAFPLRERLHFLGDSQLRLRSIAVVGAGMADAGGGGWARTLHAGPLDIALDFLVPVGLGHLGLSVIQAVSVVSLVLALAWFAGLWRVGARLETPPRARLALCAALALTGALESFAGYAESSALLLVAATWWWSEMLAPVADRRRAMRVAAAWLAMALVHRLALVMLVPQLWRALGPALPGDRPGARRLLLALSLVGAALSAGVLLAGSGAGLLAADWTNLVGSNPAHGLPRLLGPADAANTLLLLAPLVLLAPAFAGGAAVRDWLRRPGSRLLAAAVLPLLVIGPMLPVGASGFGAQRDWDLNLLLGLTLTLAAGALLAALPAPRLRAALTLALPVLALAAGSWVAVNADEGASVRRVMALAADSTALAASQRGTLHEFLGLRAMNLGQARAAGRYYERAFEIGGNRRRLLFAAEAWVAAGDSAAARAALARARAGGLGQALERAADTIERMMDAPADSGADAPPSP